MRDRRPTPPRSALRARAHTTPYRSRSHKPSSKLRRTLRAPRLPPTPPSHCISSSPNSRHSPALFFVMGDTERPPDRRGDDGKDRKVFVGGLNFDADEGSSARTLGNSATSRTSSCRATATRRAARVRVRHVHRAPRRRGRRRRDERPGALRAQDHGEHRAAARPQRQQPGPGGGGGGYGGYGGGGGRGYDDRRRSPPRYDDRRRDDRYDDHTTAAARRRATTTALGTRSVVAGTTTTAAAITTIAAVVTTTTAAAGTTTIAAATTATIATRQRGDDRGEASANEDRGSMHRGNKDR